MTLFEFIVPVVALSVAGVGILILHLSERGLDERIRRAEARPASRSRHTPAE